MSATQAEVFEAFRAIDVPEDKALRAAALASTFAKSEDETAKHFVKRDGAIEKSTAEAASLNAKLTAEVAAVDAETVKLGGDVALLRWMAGLTLAMRVTLLFRSCTPWWRIAHGRSIPDESR